MKILFVASEAVPFCKTGGLADVVGTLAQKLGAAGHDVLLFLPKYSAIRGASIDEGQARPVKVTLADETVEVGLRFLHRRSVSNYFVDYPRFFDREGLYGASGHDHHDNDRRFSLFCLAALEGAKAVGFRPDIVHAHDWQTGPVCAHLKRRYAKDPHFAGTRSVFTVHNMAYQGNFPRAALGIAGFGPEDWTSEGLEYYGQVSFLKAGLAYADRITTVSPTYAHEIQGAEHGFGFEGLLQRRSKVLRGLLNGLDTDFWDPSRDPAIARRFGSADVVSGKAACKEALQKECGLDVRSDRALIGIVSRLDYQKGLDIAMPAVEARLNRAQFVVVGTGDSALTEQFSALERRHPGKVHFHRQFDESFAHRVYAASDLFLMPSRFEPCGLGQMIAMRYGAVPVATMTGGLADTVSDSNVRTASGKSRANGFLCKPNDADDLARALDRALDAYRKPGWDERVQAAMSGDYSWDRSAAQYVQLYQEAVNS